MRMAVLVALLLADYFMESCVRVDGFKKIR